MRVYVFRYEKSTLTGIRLCGPRSQVFRIVLRGAVRDRRRSAERGGGLVRGGHLHNRVDAGVPVRVEPTVEQGAKNRVSGVRLHADGRQHGENARDRWPAVPGVHRGPHAVGSDRRRHGARQPLRRECRFRAYARTVVYSAGGVDDMRLKSTRPVRTLSAARAFILSYREN